MFLDIFLGFSLIVWIVGFLVSTIVLAHIMAEGHRISKECKEDRAVFDRIVAESKLNERA